MAKTNRMIGWAMAAAVACAADGAAKAARASRRSAMVRVEPTGDIVKVGDVAVGADVPVPTISECGLATAAMCATGRCKSWRG